MVDPFIYNKKEDYPKEFAPRDNGTCPICHSDFKIEKNYQLFCSKDCEEFTTKKVGHLTVKQCKKCDKKLINTVHRNVCTECLQARRRQASLKKAEDYWRKKEKQPKPKSKKRKVSYEELIRRSEHDRVWKDSGWSHYLKGRKWDRI